MTNEREEFNPLFGGDYGKPERGICPECETWNCQEHEDKYTDLKFNPMSSLSPDLQEKLKKLVQNMMENVVVAGKARMAAGEEGEDQDAKAKKMAEEGEDVVINTGDAVTYEKIESLTKEEREEFAEHVKELEDEAIAEENADWELPEVEEKASAPPPKGIRLAGGKVLYEERSEDNDVPSKTGPANWLDVIQTDMITRAKTGTPRTLQIFRPYPNPDRVEAIRDGAMPIVPRLHRQLQMAFEAEARVARIRQQKSGQVDKGLVAGLVTAGKDDIFSHKATKKDIKTAISIIVDDSSSMQETPGRGYLATGAGASAKGKDLLYSKNGTAGVLAYALGEVCKRMTIPFEVLSYQEGAYFSRNHYAIVYKSFNEMWDATKNRLGNYRCDAGVDVPYDACCFAARRLMARPEERRILFLLSDANACNEGIADCGTLAKELQAKAKISMVGVSILTDTMTTYMGDHGVNVLKLEELTDTVFSKIAKIIHPTT